MKRKQAIELIKRTHYGGLVPVDSSHSDREVNLMLNIGISVAAIRNYRESVNVNNEEFIGDAFYVTLNNLTVDSNNEVETSYTPVGLNIGTTISGLKVDGLQKQPIPVEAKDVFLWDELPIEKGRTGFYINGSKIKFLSKIPLTSKTVSVRMAGVPDTNDLNSELNIPSDQLSVAMEYVIGLLDKRRQEGANSKMAK